MENDKVDYSKLRELFQEFESLDKELGQEYENLLKRSAENIDVESFKKNMMRH